MRPVSADARAILNRDRFAYAAKMIAAIIIIQAPPRQRYAYEIFEAMQFREGIRMTEFSAFEAEYRDLTEDVEDSNHATFASRVRDWINLLEDTRESKSIISRIETGFEFEPWYQEGLQTGGSMVGSSTLEWAANREERLRQYMALFRHLSDHEDAYVDFAAKFAWDGPRLDDCITKIIRDFFHPFQRDLLRVLDRDWINALSKSVPASDRIVPLDHNSEDVVELRSKLAELESSLRSTTSNSLKSEPGYARNLAELSASNRLLEADEVRASVVSMLVLPCLRWFGDKTAGSVLGIAVTAAVALAASYFGFPIAGLG